MKTTFALIFITTTSFFFANEALKEARILICTQDYDKSIEIYSNEINSQKLDEKVSLSLYNDRAEIFFAKGQYERALEDYQFVLKKLANFNLEENSNRLRALCGSMFCYNFLEQDEASKSEFDRLVEAVYKIGKRIENIDWVKNNGLYQYHKAHGKDILVLSKDQDRDIQTIAVDTMSPEEKCVLQCNGYAVAAYYACSRIPHPAISFACIGCIFGLEQLCIRCCKGDGFWTNCVKPLRRLYHDPEHPENPAPHPYE